MHSVIHNGYHGSNISKQLFLSKTVVWKYIPIHNSHLELQSMHSVIQNGYHVANSNFSPRCNSIFRRVHLQPYIFHLFIRYFLSFFLFSHFHLLHGSHVKLQTMHSSITDGYHGSNISRWFFCWKQSSRNISLSTIAILNCRACILLF